MSVASFINVCIEIHDNDVRRAWSDRQSESLFEIANNERLHYRVCSLQTQKQVVNTKMRHDAAFDGQASKIKDLVSIASAVDTVPAVDSTSRVAPVSQKHGHRFACAE